MPTHGGKFATLTNLGNRVIYKAGGRSVDAAAVSQDWCERFDVHCREWSQAPQLRTPRHSHGSCALGSHVYVFCGYRHGTRLNSVEQLDTEDDFFGRAAWSEIRLRPE